MGRLHVTFPWHKRAARRRAAQAQESAPVATAQPQIPAPETPAGQLGLMIGLVFVALHERRAKKRQAEQRPLKRLNRAAEPYVPLWTMVAAVVGVFGIVIALWAVLVS